jgi:hypothetical protein
MRSGLAVVVALGMVLGVAAGEARGEAFPGSGILTGRVGFKVHGCGKGTGTTTLTLVVAADGTWTVDDGATTFSGTGVIRGKAGRKLVLTPDAAAMDALVAMLEADASEQCGGAVTATGVTTRKALVKVNARGTRGRLIVVLTATGAVADGGGRLKLRIVAGGPWAGPRSCEEVFTCIRGCAADDEACVDACLAEGTLATQEAVAALDECIAMACPLADAVCIGEAIDGTCKDVYEACVPPPPPTDLTCQEVLDCAAGCAGQRCVDDCYARGSTQGRQEATDVASCVNGVCPGGGAACQASAIAGACAYVWEACTGTPPPQNLACGAILDCLATCSAGDTACAADCRDRGSTAGRTDLAALETCVDAACPTGDPTCVGDTITGQCQSEWQTCLG